VHDLAVASGQEATQIMTSNRMTSKTRQTRLKARQQKGKRQRRSSQQSMPVLEANAAGIDVGAREMYLAIPPDRDHSKPVRVFPSFTCDREALADWIVRRGITTVAMESTGVYLIPLYQILQDREIRDCLVNFRHRKKVPGADGLARMPVAAMSARSKTAVGSLRPAQEVVAVRCMMRIANDWWSWSECTFATYTKR